MQINIYHSSRKEDTKNQDKNECSCFDWFGYEIQLLRAIETCHLNRWAIESGEPTFSLALSSAELAAFACETWNSRMMIHRLVYRFKHDLLFVSLFSIENISRIRCFALSLDIRLRQMRDLKASEKNFIILSKSV